MEKPRIEQLDEIRKRGFRPEVVCSIVCNAKVLFVFKKAYSLWQIPQGGIETGEDCQTALLRKVKEELGSALLDACEVPYTILGESETEFLPERRDAVILKTSDGNEVSMVGKHYYYFVIKCRNENVPLQMPKFDDHFWLDYKTAAGLAKKIYQSGKRRMTLEILELLKKEGYL